MLVFTSHAFDFLDLVRLGRSFDKLEHDFLVFTRIDEMSEVVEQAFVRIKFGKHLHNVLNRKLLGVLLCDVDGDLQILPHVDLEKFLKAVERPFTAQRTEELRQCRGIHRVRVHDASLQVGKLSVVLHRSHVQTSLLAQLRDARSVIVREFTLRHDGVRNIWVGDQVDFEHLGLKRRLAFVILLE